MAVRYKSPRNRIPVEEGLRQLLARFAGRELDSPKPYSSRRRVKTMNKGVFKWYRAPKPYSSRRRVKTRPYALSPELDSEEPRNRIPVEEGLRL